MTRLLARIISLAVVFALPPCTSSMASHSGAHGLGEAPIRRCNISEGRVTVTYEDEADARAACAGAGRAITFLAHHGIDTRVPVVIRILKGKSVSGPVFVFGRCVRETGPVSVPSFSDYAARPGQAAAAGLPMTEDVYVSIVAHGVTHAIADHITGDETLSVTDKEGIAFTVQLATMPKKLRRWILERVPVRPNDLADDPDGFMFALNPLFFAANTYRRFESAIDTDAFFRDPLGRFHKPSAGSSAPEWD